MIIYVRSRKDAKALSHLVSKVYKSSIEIRTFEGARSKELEEKIEKVVRDPEDYTIVLLGKEDMGKVEITGNAVVKIYYVPKARVRNVKHKLLLTEIEKAKAKFILDIYYESGKYILGGDSNFLVDITPGSDIYLVLWDFYKNVLNKWLKTNNYPLILHRGADDTVFSADIVIGRIFRPLDGPLKCVPTGLEGEDIDLKGTIRENEQYLNLKIEIFQKKLEHIMKIHDFQNIIIPWSGGKDSTTLLILLKYYTNLDFIPVYVDTGLEFEETLNYLDAISKKLGIKYEYVYAGIDKKLKTEGYEFLLERKCTKLKIETLYRFIRENFDNPLIINGDRIVESEARSFRPEFRYDGFWIFSPIKYWSYLDEELLFLRHDIPFHPLYSKGFYRIGCYKCPFIDSFESFILGL